MTKEGFIDLITCKLNNNVQLDDLEIRTIISALRKHTDTPQEPYYEVIYHDEFDNTEHRVMEPVSKRETENEHFPDYKIIDDRFELCFRRFVKKEKKE